MAAWPAAAEALVGRRQAGQAKCLPHGAERRGPRAGVVSGLEKTHVPVKEGTRFVMSKRFQTVVFGCLLWMTAVQAQAHAQAQVGTDLFVAVRNNDLRALQTAIAAKADLNTPGPRGVTPLMHAAAFGSPQAVKMLIDAGANVNATDGFGATALVWAAGDAAKARMLVEAGADVQARTTNGRTPLIVAAAHDGNARTVRLLLERGAKVNSADEQGDTALLVAAQADALDTVKLLLERGADPNDTNKGGYTPLLNASANGSAAMMRLLLTRGARVNARNTFSGMVKFGEIALKQLTPLMLAAPKGSPTAVRVLLEAGAEVNARDSRNMTPLMLAVASENQDLDVVRLLLANGAEVNARSLAGESALDWASKFGNPRVIAALEAAGAEPASAVEVPVPQRSGPLSVYQAIERSEQLLQRTSAEFFRQSGCVGCHHQSTTQIATTAARSAGVRVDEAAAAESLKQVMSQWGLFQPGLLERLDGPAAPDIQMFAAFGLAAAKQPAELVTDTLAVNIAATQRRDGGWELNGFGRAPMEEGNAARTAMSLRILQVYGPPARKAEFAARIDKARRYLEDSEAKTTDDHVWRLMGLYWSGADSSKLAQAADALRKMQRADGGWAPNRRLPADAYATGTALWALYSSGALAADDEDYQRGVNYLLTTQFEDGSWYVRSRAPKFQPYFESGFPFGPDQWISSAATAWATVALAPAATVSLSQGEGRRVARRRVAGSGE
jgi:ankyrin repeat protein